jgi:CheY-like chemotaxis protein
VAAVTAQAMAEDLRHVRAAGFDDHAIQPIDVARFDAMLQRLPP